jgi:hypothetical protein
VTSIPRFFVGLHIPAAAKRFACSFISVNILRRRKSEFAVNDWIMDSGAFTEISRYGEYRTSVFHYAKEILRWKDNGSLLRVVAQDYMCEPHILKKTGLSVSEHQRLTIERYDALASLVGSGIVMPVLQGYQVEDYVRHVGLYGDRLKPGHWVGVGSICKRNGSPNQVIAILRAIKFVRPDLRLHGFGLKTTALSRPEVVELLYSADSMSWSFAARYEGRDANSWLEAKQFETKINNRMELALCG